MVSNLVRVSVLFLVGFFVLTGHVHAAWQDEYKKLRVGMLQSHPLAQDSVKTAEFTSTYSKLLGVDVEIIKFKSLGALMDAHASARVHYAFHTSRSFVTTARICNCVQAIARPVSNSGTVGFRSVLISKNAIPLDRKNNIKIGFTRKDSISGWILPNLAIDKGEVGKFEMVELGNVENIVTAFQNGDIEGFFGWVPVSPDQSELVQSDVFNGFYNRQLGALDNSQISWWSSIVHYGPHAVHQSVPEELREDLTDILVNMDRRLPGLMDVVEPYYSGGFKKAGLEDYKSIMAALNLSADVPSSIANFSLRLR
jgi:phosphonate transport system substrate-binding protein